MTNFDFASRTLLNWQPTWGFLGLILALLGAVLVEIRHRMKRRGQVDLRRRGAGYFGWQRSSRLHNPSSCREADSRQGDGWRAEGRSRRCVNQGGSDFFDTVELDDDHVAFYLGEASGQDNGKEIYLASCQALLRYASFTPGEPDRALQEVNSVLCQREPDGRFATLLYGVLRLSTGELSLVSAGQVDTILQRSGGAVRRLALPLNLPLGMVRQPNYKALTVKLTPGDRLLVVSDGITRARDRSREPFSHERLWTVSHTHRDQSLGQWADAVVGAVERYNPLCLDDGSVLAVAFDGPQKGAA